ncbi:MAG TPA: 1-deoxy-D-xylulose-5-phosphate reductoisomerase [Candidatus Polarisedimenticolia bacterium]|nr:1-deoxy-D-xylulose-5-phosphate reductoisomerase [Candidatus Polarisedimenticolia bacterium]
MTKGGGRKRRIAILGSTGSIGVQALDLAAHLEERFEIVALAAGSNADLLARQVLRHRPRLAAVADPSGRAALEAAGRETGCALAFGEEGLLAVAGHPDADVVLAAIVGAAGLRPTWHALKSGRIVALANKESLVMAGALMRETAAAHGAAIVPVDSEHSAVHQCLRGERVEEVERILLTASGGPFRTRPLQSLAAATPEEALRHPVWDMGRKISVDSATLMNKGLEVIEAHWLFGLPLDRIEVVIHPQGIVHSMVEMADGSVLAQMGTADMRGPIQYALGAPERLRGPVPRLDLRSSPPLEFLPVEPARYPCLALACAAFRAGGSAPVALNAANEIAVEAFLGGRLPFPGIARLVEEVLGRHRAAAVPALDDVLECDRSARRAAEEILAMKVLA